MKTKIILMLILLSIPLHSLGDSYLWDVETSMLNVSRYARDAVSTADVRAFSLLNSSIEFLDQVLQESMDNKSTFFNAGTLYGMWKPIRVQAKIIAEAEGSIRMQKEFIRAGRDEIRMLALASNKIAFELSQANKNSMLVYYSTAQVVFSEKMITSLNQLFDEEHASAAMQDFVKQYKSYGRVLRAYTKGDKQLAIPPLKMKSLKKDIQKVKKKYIYIGKLKDKLLERQKHVVKAQKAYKFIRKNEFEIRSLASAFRRMK